MDFIFLIALLSCIFLSIYVSARISVRQELITFLGCAHLEIFIWDFIFVALKIISIIFSTSRFAMLSCSIRSQCESCFKRKLLVMNTESCQLVKWFDPEKNIPV